MKLASEMKRKNKQSINRGKSKETKAVHAHKAQAKGTKKNADERQAGKTWKWTNILKQNYKTCEINIESGPRR